MIKTFKPRGTINIKWQIFIDSTYRTGYTIGRDKDEFYARVVCSSFDELPLVRMEVEEKIAKEFTGNPNDKPD